VIFLGTVALFRSFVQHQVAKCIADHSTCRAYLFFLWGCNVCGSGRFCTFSHQTNQFKIRFCWNMFVVSYCSLFVCLLTCRMRTLSLHYLQGAVNDIVPSFAYLVVRCLLRLCPLSLVAHWGDAQSKLAEWLGGFPWQGMISSSSYVLTKKHRIESKW
jgi:hypothetical protein